MHQNNGIDYPPLKAFKSGDNASPRLRKVCNYASRLLLQGVQVADAIEILELCSNVRDLAIWGLHFGTDHEHPSHRLAQAIYSLSLQRLSSNLVECQSLESLAFDSFSFHHLPFLTHIDTFGLLNAVLWDALPHILSIPSLTHMAMSAKHGKDPVIFALKEKPSLLLIIKTYLAALDDLDGGEDADYMEDSRVVQIHMCELSKPGIAWVGDELWIAGEKKRREKEKKLNHMRNSDFIL